VALRLEASAALLHALANGGGQGLAQLRDALDLERTKGLVTLVVDDLQHAMQHVTVQDGRHQHLPGAVARALVDLLEEGERRDGSA
jgi:hypothetical protein